MAKETRVIIDEEVAAMPFEQAAKEWLEMVDVKKSSKATYRYMVNKKILPELAGKTLGEVIWMDEMKDLETQLKAKYKDRAVSNIFTIIRMIIRSKIGSPSSIGSNEISKNAKITFMKLTEVRRLLKYFRHDEANDPRKIGVLLALYAGMSIGEICALKWHDISMNELSIYVDKSASRIMKSEGETKSKVEIFQLDDERVVPINHQLEKWIYMYKHSYAKKEDFVLSNSDKIVEQRTLQFYLEATLKKAGIVNRYSFSQLRDTFIVYALKNGAEVSVLASILGISTSVLENKYQSFLSIRYADKARAVANVFF